MANFAFFTAFALFIFVFTEDALAKKYKTLAPDAIECEYLGRYGYVVTISDLHGDYAQYRKVLRDAGLINSRGKWAGGDAHLVQTGDITDRGPDSIAIIEHLQDLKKQARRKGGAVHTLIGNHEAMNSYGDLRYVHPGEFQHFVGRGSADLRERQWQFTLQQIEQQRPEEFKMMEVGRLCLKKAGRDAGGKCVIIDMVDNKTALIDGQTRRRNCNLAHLEPLSETLDIKKKSG